MKFIGLKIVLFGSSGFIGNNLVASLAKDMLVQEVSLREYSWKENIDANNDVFINLIGKAHDHKGIATREDFYYANVKIAQEIFEVFKHSKAKLFIHVSSLAALEEFSSEDKSLSELDNVNPTSFYGKSKRFAEEWLLSQELPKSKKLIILRPPMVHGPGDKGNLGLLYKFITKGLPYPLASFDNKRSFISTTNFNFYIEKTIENYDVLENGIYHICDNESLSTNDIISIIKNVENLKSGNIKIPKKLIYFIASVGDYISIPLNSKRLKKMTGNLILSNKKINEALNISKLPLSAEEGLIKTIESFKK